MARFSVTDGARLKEVESELGTLREGGTKALAWLGPVLRDVVGAGRALLCSYAPRGDGLCIEEGYATGFSQRFFDATDRWLKGAPVRWTAYNPLRPEPWQRNVALTLANLEATSRSEPRTAPVMTTMYRQFGIHHDDTLRVLVCEGASLLGYVGLLQADAFEARQRRMLAHLIPAMRRRMATERLLAGARSTRVMLDAALDELGAAAFVLDSAGVVLEANRVGRQWLDREGEAGRRELRDAVAARDSRRSSFRVTRVSSAGVPPRCLAVRHAGPDGLSALRRAARAWGFGPRELAVLERLGEGLSTRSIAAELGVAERTVERRLTSMFEKAQVETRAELVLQGMSLGR